MAATRLSRWKKFISLFETQYRKLCDFQYAVPLNTEQYEAIDRACNELTAKGFTVSTYLSWVFKKFLPVNEKFCPPNVKFVCSGFLLQKFFYEHKSKKVSARV